jgi:hypothetical protein
MKKGTLAIGLSAALALGILSTATTQAMPVAPLHFDGGEAGLLQQTQFFFGGRRYCFYWDGWRGPGWYWCGYAFRRGIGWGGPRGWHGWHVGARPRHGRPGVGPRPRPRPPHVGQRPGRRPNVGQRPGRPANAGQRPGAGRPGAAGRPGGGGRNR